jgi:hypothetical protein
MDTRFSGKIWVRNKRKTGGSPVMRLPKTFPKWLAISIGVLLVAIGIWIGPRRSLSPRSILGGIVAFSGAVVFAWGVRYEDLSD